MLVDDHHVLRSGLRLLINSQHDMRVSADTGEGEEAVPLCLQHRPDIVVLDLSLSGESGILILQRLKANCADVKVLVLTMHEDETYLSEVMRLGGSGFITKKTADVELLAAIRSLCPR
jgi:two-component system, NarL family, response regulator NreC